VATKKKLGPPATNLVAARKNAWSPEARAKRALTMAARKAKFEKPAKSGNGATDIPLDAIPDRKPKKQYVPRVSGRDELIRAAITLLKQALGD
jgi:hypothetical protein